MERAGNTEGAGIGLRAGIVLRGMRPRQWLKNLLVLAAPVMAGEIGSPDVLVAVALAFVAFCAAASAIYLLNDVLDAEADRAHPLKRHRPVASGRLRPAVALAVSAALAVFALGVASLANLDLVWVVAAYLALSVGYCLWFKTEPVLDIAVIAVGFLLRAVAGGAAAGIALSQWFLLAASFGSLFMAAGKRYAEVVALGPGEAAAPGKAAYTTTYLRFIWTLAAGVLIMTYGLWAFEVSSGYAGSTAGGSPSAVHRRLPAIISIAPFVLAVLRYGHAIDAGLAGEPEEIAWRDRVLQSLALAWLVLVVLAVY